jgi:toxin-antitoxin system PIN domain toxin
MILVDANVMLYAYHPRAVQHESCRKWIEQAFSGTAPVGLPWLTIWAFLRISTNPRAFEKPLTIAEAAQVVSSWLSVPVVQVVEPGERHWEILGRVLVEAQVSGPLVTDAALAALALEHGAAICTTDRDFTRFAGIRIVEPTA